MLKMPLHNSPFVLHPVAHKLKTPEAFEVAMTAIKPHLEDMAKDCGEWIEV